MNGGGLLAGLLGLAIFASVAANIMGKSVSVMWNGVKEVSHKVPKGQVKYW